MEDRRYFILHHQHQEMAQRLLIPNGLDLELSHRTMHIICFQGRCTPPRSWMPPQKLLGSNITILPVTAWHPAQKPKSTSWRSFSWRQRLRLDWRGSSSLKRTFANRAHLSNNHFFHVIKNQLLNPTSNPTNNYTISSNGWIPCIKVVNTY